MYMGLGPNARETLKHAQMIQVKWALVMFVQNNKYNPGKIKGTYMELSSISAVES